ncbi:Hsp20/alpha crystallin family protein [Luteimonas huabeiensis]|uniref:Hsp20/alpha crystallin family protein n=1 Tax=Luteimonas huabeiensis TaxID=1244513 RepID=UPI0004653273|nr:Hsp20/alpha crystallin family protein [Luteimonas huabeiensis]
MSVSQLIPWNRGRGRDRGAVASPRDMRDPFDALHREMTRLFDDLWREVDAVLPQAGSSAVAGWPRVEVVERDDEYAVSAELPGLREQDVEVEFENGDLVLRGEHRAEREERGRRISERYYGRFERRIALDTEVDVDRASAQFRDGVLTVVLPKTEQARAKPVRIPIAKAA